MDHAQQKTELVIGYTIQNIKPKHDKHNNFSLDMISIYNFITKVRSDLNHVTLGQCDKKHLVLRNNVLKYENNCKKGSADIAQTRLVRTISLKRTK